MGHHPPRTFVRASVSTRHEAVRMSIFSLRTARITSTSNAALIFGFSRRSRRLFTREKRARNSETPATRSVTVTKQSALGCTFRKRWSARSTRRSSPVRESSRFRDAVPTWNSRRTARRMFRGRDRPAVSRRRRAGAARRRRRHGSPDPARRTRPPRRCVRRRAPPPRAGGTSAGTALDRPPGSRPAGARPRRSRARAAPSALRSRGA